MFKNLVIFRLNNDWVKPSASALDGALRKLRFEKCGPAMPESFGWIEPRGEKHGPLVEVVDGQFILKLMVETKVLPGAVVKERLAEKLARIEQETGRKPKGKLKKEVKEEVIRELLPKAFTKKSAMRLWLNPKDGFIAVEAGSIKKCDRIITALSNALTDIGNEHALHQLNTNLSPATAMATWLTTQLPPEDFTVDRDCELQSTGEEKSAVRYAKHTLDIAEIVEHIEKQGKMPKRLAMTFNSRMSFVLAEDLTLKKLELLDVVLEERGEDNAGFDTDIALFTGEFSKLLPALIKALDGEAGAA